MSEWMECNKCGQAMSGVEHVAQGLYHVDLNYIRGRQSPIDFGGEYDCPHCGVTYTLCLMPYAGDPSPTTAVYRLHIMTEIGPPVDGTTDTINSQR